jgi:hypothetical protein
MQAQPTSDAPRRIPLRRRDGTIVAYALVDAEDYDWLMQWRWSLDNDGYAKRQTSRSTGQRRTVRMHRQVLGLEHGDPRQGDHINGVRLDNRRCNLRIAPRAEKDNLQNQGSQAGSVSRYRGVSWGGRQRKWKAQVTLNYKTHHLGYFDDEAEAAAVAAAFRREHMPFSGDSRA